MEVLLIEATAIEEHCTCGAYIENEVFALLDVFIRFV